MLVYLFILSCSCWTFSEHMKLYPWTISKNELKENRSSATFNVPRYFPICDHTWNPVCSNKNKPTNISAGTWYCPLITGDSSCFVKVILGWGYDTLWARYSLNIRLGCVCWVVTWQYPEETFNLFNTKCYVTCTESLSVIIHSLHPATYPSILSWKGSVRYVSLTQAWAPVVLNTVDLQVIDKHTVIDYTNKWYMLYAALSKCWNCAHDRCCL